MNIYVGICTKILSTCSRLVIFVCDVSGCNTLLCKRVACVCVCIYIFFYHGCCYCATIFTHCRSRHLFSALAFIIDCNWLSMCTRQRCTHEVCRLMTRRKCNVLSITTVKSKLWWRKKINRENETYVSAQLYTSDEQYIYIIVPYIFYHI